MAASETNQLFSSSSDEMRRFIFNRLQKMDNQRTLYALRLLQKSEQKAVEKKIQTAKIDFTQIKQFATSNFRIKFLRVSMRIPQDSCDDLKYLSTTYLPNAQNIHIKIYPSFEWNDGECVDGENVIYLKIHEPLIFQHLHLENYSNAPQFVIKGNYNVEIRDCKFIGIGVYCLDSASIFVTGSKFQNIPFTGLSICYCASVYFNKIIVENCKFEGLRVVCINEDVNINNVRVVSCGGSGIFLYENDFKLSNTTIKDCKKGIYFIGINRGEIQKTNMEGCKEAGIYIRGGAIVRYAFVEFNHNVENIKIDDDDEAQFLPLKVIR